MGKSKAQVPSWRPWPHALPQSLDPHQAGSGQSELNASEDYVIITNVAKLTKTDLEHRLEELGIIHDLEKN